MLIDITVAIYKNKDYLDNMCAPAIDDTAVNNL